MSELTNFMTSWGGFFSLLGMLAILGFAPGTLLHIVVRLYPPDDPRRAEFLNELHHHGYLRRVVFVFEVLDAGLWDGLPLRIARARGRRGRAGLRDTVSMLLAVVLVLLGLAAGYTLILAEALHYLGNVPRLPAILLGGQAGLILTALQAYSYSRGDRHSESTPRRR